MHPFGEFEQGWRTLFDRWVFANPWDAELCGQGSDLRSSNSEKGADPDLLFVRIPEVGETIASRGVLTS